MTTDQTLLFGILVVLFGMLVWGRFRYDLVAFVALLVTVMVGADRAATLRHLTASAIPPSSSSRWC
jgi:hypothetical protein